MRGLRRSAMLLSVLVLALVAALVFSNAFRQTLISEVTRQAPSLRNVLGVTPSPLSERLQKKGFVLGQPVLLRVFKEEGELEVWLRAQDRYALFAVYPICKWSGGLGPKLKEGDWQAPEGYYFASSQQLLKASRYHRAINTGFPNVYDRHHGRTGSVLMIHGSCVSTGCYAMTDAGIDDIYNLAEAALAKGNGDIEMHLYPFRLTEDNFARHAASPWIAFWRNLAEGDAIFNTTRTSLSVHNCNGRYAFGSAPSSCERVAAWP
jgi:murein L,D-transpeptidase YafK